MATAPAPAEPKAKPKPAPKKEAAPAENSTAKGAEEEEDDEEQIRGYKILADGRKTSFFDHQMSEEEKVIIHYKIVRCSARPPLCCPLLTLLG